MTCADEAARRGHREAKVRPYHSADAGLVSDERVDEVDRIKMLKSSVSKINKRGSIWKL